MVLLCPLLQLVFGIFPEALTFVGPRAALFLRADVRSDDERARTTFARVFGEERVCSFEECSVARVKALFVETEN